MIPARLAATRLPDKPLRDVGGAPLVVRVWERVTGLGVADACVVATDSLRVVDAVERAGGQAVLTRPDHPSGTDRVAEVAERREFAEYDALLNVQGDEPFVSAETIRNAIAVVADGDAPIGTAATPASTDELVAPDVVKVVVDDDHRALYFSRAPIPFLREPDDEADRRVHGTLVRRHLGIYVYTREALLRWVTLPVHPLERVERLEQLRPLAHGIAIGVAHATDAGGPGVDTPADLARADALWRRLHAISGAAETAPLPHVAGPVASGPHSAAEGAPTGAPTDARPEPAR